MSLYQDADLAIPHFYQSKPQILKGLHNVYFPYVCLTNRGMWGNNALAVIVMILVVKCKHKYN